MRLSFQNIGKVAKADIEVDAITVITGKNDTGKSTVGKLLYGIYTALNQLTPKYLLLEKWESILDDLDLVDRLVKKKDNSEIWKGFSQEIRQALLLSKEDSFMEEREKKIDTLIKDTVTKLKAAINCVETLDDRWGHIEAILDDVIEKTKIKSSNKDTKRLVIENILLGVFTNSLTTELNSKPKANIHFKENDDNVLELELSNNKIIKDSSRIMKQRDFFQVFYIDNPFILDDLDKQGSLIYRERKINDHTNNLLSLLLVKEEKNFFEEAMKGNDITNILSSVLSGDIRRTSGVYKYYSKELEEPISIKSISAGMKSFAILKLLIEYGHLNKRSEMLILDEPEVHLHPDWQLKYAELIVLLAKEYHLRVLITSHSSDFIEAIDLYSKKHEIDKGVNFYKTNALKNGMSEIINVTDDLKPLYANMVGHIEIFEKMEEELDER